jgi:hypothetical protein
MLYDLVLHKANSSRDEWLDQISFMYSTTKTLCTRPICENGTHRIIPATLEVGLSDVVRCW